MGHTIKHLNSVFYSTAQTKYSDFSSKSATQQNSLSLRNARKYLPVRYKVLDLHSHIVAVYDYSGGRAGGMAFRNISCAR